MSKPTGAERSADMVEGLRKWQAIERQSMDQTALVMENTSNPFIRLVMEVIRHDSLMHHRVQQTIIDSLTRADVPLSFDELGAVWKQIEEHDETEREVIELAKSLREKAWQPLHKMLLDYLIEDEKKHDRILEALGEVKKDLSRATT